MSKFLQSEFLNNTVEEYLWFIGIIAVVIILGRPLAKLIISIFYRFFRKITEENLAEQFKALLQKPLYYFILFTTVYLSFDLLKYPPAFDYDIYDVTLHEILYITLNLIFAILITWLFLRLADFVTVILESKAAKTETKADDQLVSFARDVLKIIIVVGAIFFVFGAIFKINISGLIAGAGIAGLAIALAAKDSLENLFGSFTIFTDKPFTVGDFVQVGDVMGTVEKVGFRSTRIRTLDKTFVTLPNRKIMDSSAENLSLRTFRRVKMVIGVTYDTNAEKIKAIVKDIQEFIDGHELTNQDGIVGFHDFGDSALEILVLYYVQNMDWNTYVKVREEINFRIMEIVETRGSDFAFPTRTLYVKKEN
jgi:MscS family membrane protein